MEALIPLRDEDRWGWLEDLSQAALSNLETNNVVLVACSALKKAYRDIFRKAVRGRYHVKLTFIYTRIDEATSMERVERRRIRDGHYMKPGLVRSQVRYISSFRLIEELLSLILVYAVLIWRSFKHWRSLEKRN
jgi:gluconokinase